MIYVIRAGQGGKVAIGYTTEPTRTLESLQGNAPEVLELSAILPGGKDEELDVQASLAGHHLHGPWFSLPGYDPAKLVRALLETRATPGEPSYADLWNSRTTRLTEESEGPVWSIVIGPQDFFPPPTPGLEWAHERYFHPSPKDWMFDVPDGASLGDHREGFRSTRRSP